MNVLVDTAIWSLAFRRSQVPIPEPSHVVELRHLIDQGRAHILGPIRQELLSGVKAPEQFEKLRTTLRAFPDLPLASADYERAAELSNTCRSKGIQGSNTDFLLCAVSQRLELAVFTTDLDFTLFARVLPLRLHQLPPS